MQTFPNDSETARYKTIADFEVKHVFLGTLDCKMVVVK